MELTFRTKLLLIIGGTSFAFALVILLDILSAQRHTENLDTLQARYLPLLEIAPQLDADLKQIHRRLQEAVDAQDVDGLKESRGLKDRFIARLGAAEKTIGTTETAAVRRWVDAYFNVAEEVSRRMISGETGESLVDAVGRMQTAYSSATSALENATRLDRTRLAAAFEALRTAEKNAQGQRLWIAFACLVIVTGLSTWSSRGVLRALGGLSRGFERFGAGDFSARIPVLAKDELGDLATQANVMADSLKKFIALRDLTDWIKTGQAGFAQAVRNDAEADAVAKGALEFVARHAGALAGSFYLAEGTTLRRAAGFAREGGPNFEIGEGLIGRTAQKGTILAIEPLDATFDVKSGLGDLHPGSLLFLPIREGDDVWGVIELAFLAPLPEERREFLRLIGASLITALAAARERATRQRLLVETQQLAGRLTEQEEELRVANEELEEQQEELRHTNRDLTRQADELHSQRGTLEAKNLELEEARRRIQLKVEEIQAVSTYKSQFVANMSHELRTPLNSMLLLSHLLGENEGHRLSEKEVEFAKTIHAAGQDLLGLINQVLDLAKIEAGKLEVRPIDVPIRDVVNHLARVYRPIASAKGIALDTTIAGDLPANLHTDRQRLDQILTNLLGNAIKFTDRGAVSIEVRRLAADEIPARRELRSGIAFVVADSGIGIAPEHHAKVFAPFEQVDGSAERRAGGTGLGLAIAQELAHLLGGEIFSLRSTLGEGSRFILLIPEARVAEDLTIDFPRLRAPAVKAVAPKAPAPKAPAPEASRGPTLLVIEDDPLFAEWIANLASEQGLSVMIAATGEAGLELARAQAPSGIVLDVGLPDIDGFAVIKKLREDPATLGIPVHFISALDDRERGLALGAIGYLEKPAARGAVVEAVRSLMRGQERLLIVEDDPVLGGSLVETLRGEGVNAMRVGTAKEALTALRTGEFGCLILDLGLPDIDGLAFLDIVHEDAAIHAVPVIVHTGRALSRAEIARLQTYAEAVVMKDGRSNERLLEEIRLFFTNIRGSRAIARLHPFEARGIDLSGRSILIADDDMRTVYAITALLRSKGANVTTADNGAAALAELGKGKAVDVVLMDIMMPEMDGFEAIRRIRADPRMKSLPVIALTAKAMKGDRKRCLDAGASDYLTKPLEPERLLSLVQAWVQTSR